MEAKHDKRKILTQKTYFLIILLNFILNMSTTSFSLDFLYLSF